MKSILGCTIIGRKPVSAAPKAAPVVAFSATGESIILCFFPVDLARLDALLYAVG